MGQMDGKEATVPVLSVTEEEEEEGEAVQVTYRVEDGALVEDIAYPDGAKDTKRYVREGDYLVNVPTCPGLLSIGEPGYWQIFGDEAKKIECKQYFKRVPT